MLKISYAGCLGLFPAISVQFTLEMRVAAQNREKFTKTSYFGVQGHSRSSLLTFLRSLLLVLDKQHVSVVCAYLQPFSR